MKHTNQKLKLIGILTPILILAGIILIALTGNKVNILKTQVAEETGKITQETETAKVYDAYMLINELSKIDGTDLNGNGNGIKITTSADDLTLKAYSVVNDELISENENKDIIVPESGIKLKVEGITEGKTYEIEIANGTTDAEYKTDFVKAVITIDATGEDSLVAYVKETTKVVNGEEITEEGSKEETAIFMYEDETNKIKIKGNGDLEMYYTLGSLDGLTEEELKTATWKEYDKTNGLEVEHNCKIYAKSKYKTGEYSDISEIRVDNIDKLAPTITVTGKEEKAEESTSVTVKITDEENEKYGASGIVAYKMTKMETEPKEWIEIENTKEYETEIGEIQKNGTYYLWAKDKVGNVGHVSFDVTNIEVKVVAVILDSPVESLIGTEYTSLEALQTALEENNITAESGKVIVQLENNVYYETMKIANKDITIDLNGYMIKAKTEEPVIDVESGKVNLVDGKYKFADYITNTEKAEELAGKYTAQNDYGKIINETGNGINIEEVAEFTLGTDDELISIASPEIKAGETGIHNNNGTFNFYDGIITAKITNDGSTTVEGEKVETGITDTPRLYDPTTRQTEGEEEKYTTYLAKVSGIEAVIGKTRYTKLEYAIEAANDLKGTPETQVRIDIVKDINKDASIEINNTKNIILNLNGYTLTNSVADYVIKNAGKLEITDTTVEENHVYDNNDETTIKGKILTTTGGVIDNKEGAELTITEGTLITDTNYTSWGVYQSIINNNGKLIVNGGYIKSKKTFKRGIYNLENGTTEINNGKMYFTGDYSRAIENAATGTESAQVIINNTEITAAANYSYIYNADNGIIDIKGGIFNIDFYQYGTGTMNISGGKNTWTLYNEKGTVNISNTAQLRYIENRNSAVINMDGGEISSTNSRGIYATNTSVLNIANSKIKISNSEGIFYESSGTSTIRNSEIIAETREAIENNGSGTIKIDNSIINASGNYEYYGEMNDGIRNNSSGTIEIDNSIITSANKRGIYNAGSGTIKIQTNDESGSTTINSGTYGILNNTSGVITLGKKDGVAKNNIIIESNNIGIDNLRKDGKFNYYDGIIIGKSKAITGIINELEESKDVLLENIEEKEKAYLGTNEAICYVGEDETNTYDSIASAIENIETEGKITLLKNVVISANNSIEIPEEKKITLDINGKEIEIHKYEKAILNDGELIIQDNVADSTGKIFGYANNAIIYNEADKIVTIESGKISYNQCGIDNQYADGIINNGILNIKNGKLETTDSYSNLINSNGTINYENGTMTIKGKNANGINSNATTNVNEGIININADNSNGIYNTGELSIKNGNLNAYNYGARCIENIGTAVIENGNLTKTSYYGVIDNCKDLYIKGGTIKNTNGNAIVNKVNTNNIGKIKMTGGIVQSTNGSDAIDISDNAEIDIADGEVISEGVGIHNYNKGKIKMTGGKITAKREGIYNYNRDATGGEVTIEGGEISSRECSGIYNNSYYGYAYKTTVKVTGGEIKTESTNKDVAYSSGIYNAGVSEVILGENDEGVPSQENSKITGTTYGVYNVTANNKFYFYDGIITGKVGQSIYGKVTEIPTDYTIQKYKTGENENIEVAEGMESAVLEQINIAKIESTGIEYPSLRKALNAVTQTDTVTILQSFEVPQTENSIEIAAEKNITVNLNGKKITASNENTIINNGELNITDTTENVGEMVSNNDTLILNNENAILNINNGNISFIVTKEKSLINNKGTVNINGGTININADNSNGIYNTGELSIKNGNLNAYNYGAKCIENIGTAVIENGNLTKTSYYGVIDNCKDLYIKGGTIKNTSGNAIVNKVNTNNIGKIKMTGGIVQSTNGSEAINIYDNAEIDITDGEVISEGVGIHNYNKGKIKMTGGKITTKREGIYNYNRDATGGEVTIEGGEISSRECSGIYNNSYYGYAYKTTVKVTGGEIKTESTNKDVAYSSGIYNAGVSEVILGENDEGVPSQESPKITGTTYGVYNVTANNKFYFYDGRITGKVGQSIYGKVTEMPTNYTIQKYKTGENENIEVAEGMESSILENTNVVRVESSQNTYIYLKEAIENAESTDTITVLKDFIIPTNEEISTITAEKNITINLNGKKIIASNENTIINNGELNITDTTENVGEMVSNNDTLILNNENAILNINNGNISFIVTKEKSLINNKGTANINGGTININADNSNGIYNTGELSIKNGNLNAYNYGAKCIENIGTAVIENGNLTKTSYYGVIDNCKDLYIKGGTIKNTSGNAIVNKVNTNNIGKIKMTGGIVQSTNGSEAINIYDNAEIDITDGEVISEGVGIHNYNKGKIKMTGGKITTKREGIYNYNRDATGGEVTIEGGEISSRECSGIYNNSYYGYAYKTTVKVTGGEIKTESTNKDVAYSSGIYNAGASEVILGENDEGVPSQESPKITGTTYGVYNVTVNNKFYFYDGIITGGTLAIYGTVTGTPESYMVVYKDSSQKIAVLDKVADFDNQICVDGTYYDTLDSAITVITNKANKTGRILLYSDVELLTPATIPEGVNITLEMQGQRMLYRSGTDAAITNNGTLTIIDYADLSDGDSDTISSIENTQGIAIQNNGTLTIGQANNNNMTSPKIIGTTAIAGNEATKLSGTITNTNSTVGMAQSRQIAKIQKMEENNQTANDTKTKLSSTPDLIVESTEWTKENVPVGMRADITPILNLYLVENIKTAEYKVEYYYDGKIDESKTFTDEVDIGTQINSYEDKVKEGYVLEKVEGIPLTVEENTDNNIIKVYYTKRIDLSYTVNYLEKGTNKIIHESKTVTDKTYGDTVQATQEIIEIDGYNYESSDKETLTITTEGNEINIYYIKKKDLRYTVNYLEKETNNKLHESKVQGNMTYESTVISNDEVIEIEGYNYDSVDKPTISITTGTNEINIYYTKRTDLSYIVNYQEKETNKTLLESKIVKNQTYGTSIDIESEKVEINGYNYDSTDKTELIIGTDVNVLNIYYTKKNDLSYTVNYLEKGTNKVLYEAKTYNNQVFETKINAVDEAININGYKYDSSSVETLTIGTGENVINIYYTKVDGLSYTINYLEKYTNKVLHEPETKGNQTFENEITSRNEVIEIDGYNYESADPETLVIGTTDNIINIYYTKKNDLSYTVNYLEKDTDKVLHEAKVVENKTFEEVVTSSNEIIEIDGYYYDSVDPETLVVGTNENIINIYYTKRNDLSYTANYLEKDTDKVLHEAKVIENKTFEEVVTSSDEIIEINGYNYDSVDPENLTITTGANVINIYYTKRNDLSYTVNYLEKDTDKVLHEAKVVNNKTFEELITSSNEVIEIDGYNYESTDPETLVIGTTDNIINIYYTKKNDLSYTVNYLEKDTDKVLHEAKVVENKTFEEVVTSSNEIIEIDGYYYDSVDPETLVVGTNENIINIYYTKRNDLSYTVNYLGKDTEEMLQESKTVENKTFEEVVTSSDEIIKINGYNYDSVDPENLTITTGENIINIYYTKRNDLSYTVKYIDRDTKEEIQEEKIVTGKTYKETVNAEEEKTEIYGYNYETADPEVLTIEVENNVINLYYTRKTSTVVIKHCEEGTEQQISENVIITGKVGEKYKAEIAEDIPEKYEFTRAEGETEGIITEEPQTITMYYSKKATKVIVNYINEETQEKMKDSEGQEIESIEIEGKVDDFYTTVSSIKIPSKYELVEIPENSAGRMTIDEIIVNYYYRRKETRVVVHHYEEGTTNKLSENVVITGKVDDTYETKAATDIPVKYEYAYVEGDTAGIMTEEEIHIFYYYKVKESKLTVRYVDKNHDTEIIQADETIGKVDDKYETQAREIEGYTLVGNSENTEGTLKVEPTEVIYYYKKNTAVQVKYIDIDTDEELSQETIEGLEGDEYQTESKNFERYVLVKETENTEGTMTREEIIVKYYYEHLSKGVIEKHIDITTNEILENKVYTGKYGTPYTTKVKTIEGYDVVEERLPENAEGTMIEDVIEVNYYYIAKAKINVEYIDRATGKNLDISDVIIGHEGDTYQTEEKTFEGYNLIEIVGNAEGTMTKGETTIKYIYARPTKVIVRYINQITGENLITSNVGDEPITIIGYEGDSYQTEEKTITGYDLVKTSENTEGTMAKEDIEVTYYYIAKTKVVVNYIDRVTGESLIPSDIDPIIITGHEGDTYKTESKTFAGYDLVKTSENTEGRMTKETIEVTYYYARPAKVIVNYLDEETGKTIENIKEEIITGYEGDSYKTEAKELEYYRVARTSENTEGIMEVRVEKEIIDNTTIVNYYYKKKDYNFSIEKTLESIKKDEKATEITGTIGKIELTKGQLKTAKVQVVYNIKVKNTGEIAGKVKVLEKIPAGMKMNKEDNPEWEISNTVATIETNEIEPGKEENIKVVLTWINSETNLGAIENIAEIQDTSSKSGFKDNNSKDDTDKVDIIVAISTGEKTYIATMGLILSLLSVGVVILTAEQRKNN